MLDAPVSGGVGGAEAGTLTFMVSLNSTLCVHILRASARKHLDYFSLVPSHRSPFSFYLYLEFSLISINTRLQDCACMDH